MFGKLVAACGLAAGALCAQEWEIGAIGGYGFAPDLTVKGPTASATTGFKNGFALGAFGGNDTYEHWSGELRYLYRDSTLKLSSAGTSVEFGGRSHYATGDFLWHLQPRESNVRFFALFGGGIKVLEGTGRESAAQPLGRFAALTHTRETMGVGDVGIGVKVYLKRSVGVRFEVHDYITAAPSKVIAPAPTATLTGVVNDVIATASIFYRW
jgi:hypothetical protein